MFGRKRDRPRPKVGLALGGGAARGMAHIGVLEILHRAGVPVDVVAGTSAGALIGALYASGMSPARIRAIAHEELDWKHIGGLLDIALGEPGLVRGRKVVNMLRDVFDGDIDFADMKIPFGCVAVDLNTGEEVVMREGPVLSAVRASISIPGIFTPVERGERVLVDGVLRNPLPVDVARALGADYVIAVNVMPIGEQTVLVAPSLKDSILVTRNIFSVLLQSSYVMSLPIISHSLKSADFTIQPEAAHIGAEDFHRVKELIIQGELKAEEELPRLRQHLHAFSADII